MCICHNALKVSKHLTKTFFFPETNKNCIVNKLFASRTIIFYTVAEVILQFFHYIIPEKQDTRRAMCKTCRLAFFVEINLEVNFFPKNRRVPKIPKGIIRSLILKKLSIPGFELINLASHAWSFPTGVHGKKVKKSFICRFFSGRFCQEMSRL